MIMGDMNISPTDLDIGIGETNRKRWLRDGKCSFLPEEREWLDRLYNYGLVDTFRVMNPQANDNSRGLIIVRKDLMIIEAYEST
ncbi:exonuclease III [Actinobacillus equuli]|nr:exonuclease III [Actinobacillus equuli]